MAATLEHHASTRSPPSDDDIRAWTRRKEAAGHVGVVVVSGGSFEGKENGRKLMWRGKAKRERAKREGSG